VFDNEVNDGSLLFDLEIGVDQGSANLTRVEMWADKWMARDDVNGFDGLEGDWDEGNWSPWYGDNISMASWSNEQTFARRSPGAEVSAGVPWEGAFDSKVFTRRSFSNAYENAPPSYQGLWRVSAWAQASAKGGNIWSQGGDDSSFWVDCTDPTVPMVKSDSAFTAHLQYCEEDGSFDGPWMWDEETNTKVACAFTYP
jgi:hypothetical protein